MSYIRWSTEGTSGKWYIYCIYVNHKSIKMQKIEISTITNNQDEIRTQHKYHEFKRNWDKEIEKIKLLHGEDSIEEIYDPIKRFMIDMEKDKEVGKLTK